jgi:hypothetical protein
LDIFSSHYYPQILSDWWMDDWISRVYGSKRTFLISNVQVKHHFYQTSVKRYRVNLTHSSLLSQMILEGKRKIQKYLREWNETEGRGGEGGGGGGSRGVVMKTMKEDEIESLISEFEPTRDDHQFKPRQNPLTTII